MNLLASTIPSPTHPVVQASSLSRPRSSSLGPAPRGRSAGFTLLEIMVVVIILGVLAATIIPQFVGATDDAKVSAAQAHVSELESALERVNLNLDRYPTTDEGLKLLVAPPTTDAAKWRGPYVKQVRNDPWGEPYQYRCPGIHHPHSFDLWSRGADRADGGEGKNADLGNW
jgi:general secretion pathway protein G